MSNVTFLSKFSGGGSSGGEDGGGSSSYSGGDGVFGESKRY